MFDINKVVRLSEPGFTAEGGPQIRVTYSYKTAAGQEPLEPYVETAFDNDPLALHKLNGALDRACQKFEAELERRARPMQPFVVAVGGVAPPGVAPPEPLEIRVTEAALSDDGPTTLRRGKKK